MPAGSAAGGGEIDSNVPVHAAQEPGSGVPSHTEPTASGVEAAAADAAGTSRGQSAVERAVYAAAGTTLLLHSVLIDGLQKIRHFRKAGGCGKLFTFHCISVCTSLMAVGICWLYGLA